MHPSLHHLPRQPLQLRPRLSFIHIQIRIRHRYGHVISTSPVTSVFDVVVAWHEFGDYGDVVFVVPGEEEGRGEADYAGAVVVGMLLGWVLGVEVDGEGWI